MSEVARVAIMLTPTAIKMNLRGIYSCDRIQIDNISRPLTGWLHGGDVACQSPLIVTEMGLLILLFE